MLKNLRKSESGFTLIELLIVVAIIGILAAIAIPQFASYRQRAFNSAAESDVKNVRVAEESLFSDFQVYGTTAPNVVLTAAVGVAAGVITDGAAVIAAGSVNTVATLIAGQAQAIGVSNNVNIIARGDAALASVVLIGEHRQGDRAFAMDSDSTILYYSANPAWVGVPVTGTAALNANIPTPPVPAADDLSGVAGGGVAPTVNWTPK